jgi:hypothetical protein
VEESNNNMIQFLSYNLMFNSGEKFRALHKKKNSNSRVVQKQISERNKKPYPSPSPLQVKWSVPKWNANLLFISQYINNNKSAGYLQEIAS